MDTQGKETEQTSRKVTLIEVRGNQERVTPRSPQEGLGKAQSTRPHIKESRSKQGLKNAFGFGGQEAVAWERQVLNENPGT